MILASFPIFLLIRHQERETRAQKTSKPLSISVLPLFYTKEEQPRVKSMYFLSNVASMERKHMRSHLFKEHDLHFFTIERWETAADLKDDFALLGFEWPSIGNLANLMNFVEYGNPFAQIVRAIPKETESLGC